MQVKNLEGAVICLINTEGCQGPKHTFAHMHTRTVGSHKSMVYINLPLPLPCHTHSLCLIFSQSLPLAASIFLPQDPLTENNFSPENKCGTLIKVLISDPAAFRNITLNLRTVTVITMI